MHTDIFGSTSYEQLVMHLLNCYQAVMGITGIATA